MTLSTSNRVPTEDVSESMTAIIYMGADVANLDGRERARNVLLVDEHEERGACESLQ